MNIMVWIMMRSPILLVRYYFVIFFRSLLFLAERIFIDFSGIPRRSISRFHFSMAFIFYQLLLPSGPLAPSSHEIRCNPANRSS